MKQREFPFIAAMPDPRDAPVSVVAQCRSESEAIVTSMKYRHAGKPDGWFARELRISRSYFSEIKTGTKPAPEWFWRPFAVLTGINLLPQWHDYQEAKRAAEGKASRRDRTDFLAAELRAA